MLPASLSMHDWKALFFGINTYNIYACLAKILMKYTKELLEPIVKDSVSVLEVLRKLGKNQAGGTHRHISNKIKEFGIDTSHFVGREANQRTNYRGGTKKKEWQEVLVLRQDSKREVPYLLRRSLIEYGREYQCENSKCLIQHIWLGNELTLHVDHINGNWRDNRPENLRFLCPNCHSQTDNYCGSKGYTDRISVARGCKERYRLQKMRLCANQNPGKKVPHFKARKVERPSKEKLQQLVWTKPTTHLAKDFGVSDKAIEKWCKAYEIEKPPRGYWAKKQYSNLEIIKLSDFAPVAQLEEAPG